MNCDIIIPVWNQLKYTKECLDSLFKYTAAPFRLIIVDNASDAPAAQYLDELKQKNAKQVILIRNSENLGWIKAVNQGIQHSNSAYLCVMNNDTVVYPGWLSEMLGVAEKDKTVGLVNPLWELPKRPKMSMESYFNKIVTQQRGEYIETDYARGFCFLVKREVINKIGGLDEIFSPGYYDDWDYSARAAEAGFRCARAKGAFVWHYRSITYSEILKQPGIDALFEDKGKIFYRKWGRPLKVLLIIDSSLKESPPFLNNLGLSVLRDQNSLFAITSRKIFYIEHTNCKIKYCLNPVIRAAAILNIIDNLRHSSSKRYNLILCSPRINKFFNTFPFVKNNYLIKEVDNHLKNQKDLIKELADLKRHE